MKNFRQHFDAASLLVMIITLVLFIAALYFTGFTHDLLLEAGVFLVSVKLILMSYKNKVASDSLQKELGEIRSLILEMNNKSRLN
jgi:predicted neutral ceramidase superfamily lipid hydrolase